MKHDEYIGEDGLLYCKYCHTPRQYRAVIAGQEQIVPALCRCQAEERDRQQEEDRQRKAFQRIQRLKSAGLQDKALYNYCFANDNGCNPQIRHAHTYVDRWDEMKRDCIGLILWGDVGTGKSFFAGCIANTLLDQEIPVLMTNFARILNALTGMYGEERNQYIDSLCSYDLLILDDLGIERSTDYGLEQVFNVVDSRYRCRKPMIICTNLTLEELRNPPDLAHARIYDRILENCQPVRINDYSFRKENARRNLEKAKEIFK